MSCERLKNIQTDIKALIDNPNSKMKIIKNFMLNMAYHIQIKLKLK